MDEAYKIKPKAILLGFSIFFVTMLILIVPFSSWLQGQKNPYITTKKIVTTTTMLNDLVKHLIGDVTEEENNQLPPEKPCYVKIENIETFPLMGIGIDPHNYKIKLSDRKKIKEADLVVANGLHLEAKMVEAFELLTKKDKFLKAGEDASLTGDLLQDEDSREKDPHIWFDPDLWIKILGILKDRILELLPSEEANIKNNYTIYQEEIQAMAKLVKSKITTLGDNKLLVTAHDAFRYLAKKYDLKLESIQGISTQTEASIAAIDALACKLCQDQVKTIFVESSMPKDSLKSLQEATRAKGHAIKISEEELYSDSLGSPNKRTKMDDGKIYTHDTYIGAFLHNIEIIVKGLKQ